MASRGPSIQWSTNIITFYNAGYWGIDRELSHSEWKDVFNANPRAYFEAMFDGVREAGITGVELAPEPAGFDAALLAYGSAQAMAASLADRGLRLSSSYAAGRQLIGDALIDPSAEATADAHVEAHAAFVAELGARTIVMGNIPRSRFGSESPDDTATAEDFSAPVPLELHEKFAEQLNRLGAIAGRHGVQIAIHTDAYSVCSRPEDIATVLSLTDPATITICPDAGHITLDGGDAVAVLRENIDRIPTMHWKDCHTPLSGHLLRGAAHYKDRHREMLTHFAVMGQGLVDWPEWMRVLAAAEWSGWAVEELDHSPDPVGELRQGLEYFRTELAPIYS